MPEKNRVSELENERNYRKARRNMYIFAAMGVIFFILGVLTFMHGTGFL